MLRSRDDRRRRSLTEESQRAESALPDADVPRTGERALYARSASLVTDRRLRDLIPRKRRYVSALSTIAATLIGLILAAHLWRSELCELLATETLPGLDLSAPTHLAKWFVGVALGFAGLLATLVCGLRRFRLDDYRGQYRLWAIVAGLCATMSVCTVAPLHEVWRLVCVRITGFAGWDAGSMWWSGPVVLAWTAVGIRLCMELRRSRFALTCYAIGMTGFTIALVAGLGERHSETVDLAAVVWGAYMLAAATLLIGLVWYARHVLLEIDGLMKQRAKSEKPPRKLWRRGEKFLAVDQPHTTEKKSVAETSKKEPENATEKNLTEKNVAEKVVEKTIPRPHIAVTRKEPPKPSPLTAAVNSVKAKQDADDEDDDDDDSSSGGKPKLSRAERKRLRKQQRDE